MPYSETKIKIYEVRQFCLTFCCNEQHLLLCILVAYINTCHVYEKCTIHNIIVLLLLFHDYLFLRTQKTVHSYKSWVELFKPVPHINYDFYVLIKLQI